MHEDTTLRFDRIPMLIRGLRHAGFCVLYQDRDLAVRMVENPFDSWPEAAVILTLGDRGIFDAATAERVIAAKRRVVATGTPERLEAQVRRHGLNCWYELNIDPDFDPSGEVRGLFVTASDITELKAREEALRGLIAEVSHRSRNLLAIVQGILGQSIRQTADPAAFAAKFRGRIQSLATTQDLVTQASWQGAAFRHLVSAQLDPFTRPAAFQLEIIGEDPLLSPAAALHVGLALHELAANSAAHGVLRHGAGRITLAAATDAERLRISWAEEHTAAIAPPGPGRFGSTVLTRVLPSAINGRAHLEVTPEAVRYTLDLPPTALL